MTSNSPRVFRWSSFPRIDGMRFAAFCIAFAAVLSLVAAISACIGVEEVERTVEVERQFTVEKVVTVEVEKLVEVPVTVEVEKLVEVPVTVEVEKLVEVPVTVEVEKLVEVPVTVEVEKLVEVPVTVEVEKLVEVPVTVEVEKLVEVPVTVKVEKLVEVPVTVEVQKLIEVEKRVEVPVTVEVEQPVEVVRVIEVIVPATVEIERHVVVDSEVGKESRTPVVPVLVEYQDFNWSLDTERWLMLGTAEHSVSEGTVQLTDARNHQLGVLLHRQPVRWGSFTIRFSFEISGGSGADGLALLLLTSLPNFNLFADRTTYPAGGYWASHLLEGYLVAFDTHRNLKGFWRDWYYPVDDPSSNFVALAKLDAGWPQELLSHLATADLPLDLRDSGVFEAEVEVRDQGVVDVYLTNSEAGMDRALVMRSSIRDFPGSHVYFGFVASTGDFDDRHVIHSVRYESK